jgi:GNAT superfamily N-acetyltransferase
LNPLEIPAAVTIRPGGSGDGRVVRRLVFDILNEYHVAADPDDSDADVMGFGTSDSAWSIDLVAEHDGEVVGSAMVRMHSGGWGKLSKLFVLPGHRRLGIGRALMDRAIESARGLGYSGLEIHTRARYREAVALYESTGWTRGPDRSGDGPTRVYVRTLG